MKTFSYKTAVDKGGDKIFFLVTEDLNVPAILDSQQTNQT